MTSRRLRPGTHLRAMRALTQTLVLAVGDEILRAATASELPITL